jgi:antitoxin MazE
MSFRLFHPPAGTADGARPHRHHERDHFELDSRAALRRSFAIVDKSPLLAYIQCRYMATTTQLSKWGNSLGLRLPKSVTREVQLGEGDTVQVSVHKGAIVIRPSRPRYSLDELVRRITPKNRHDESDWGSPLGDEVW